MIDSQEDRMMDDIQLAIFVVKVTLDCRVCAIISSNYQETHHKRSSFCYYLCCPKLKDVSLSKTRTLLARLPLKVATLDAIMLWPWCLVGLWWGATPPLQPRNGHRRL